MKARNSHGLLQLHVGREALAYCQCLYRENKALFVSVDLIGEKNQVILEYYIILQGTLIRVFDVATRKQLVELRRGADPAMLYWYV